MLAMLAKSKLTKMNGNAYGAYTCEPKFRDIWDGHVGGVEMAGWRRGGGGDCVMRVMKQGRDGGGEGRSQKVHLALLLLLLLFLLLSLGPLKQLQGAPPVALLPGPFSGVGQVIQGWDEWMNG